jgi:hypothetical protein
LPGTEVEVLEKESIRAGELLRMSFRAPLEAGEVQEAAVLVERLAAAGLVAEAQKAYGAIRSTFVKRGRPQNILRSIEREALSCIRREKNRRCACRRES